VVVASAMLESSLAVSRRSDLPPFVDPRLCSKTSAQRAQALCDR
jgi:hypothetical protein